MFDSTPAITWTVPYDDAASFLTTATTSIDAFNTLKVFFDPVPHHDSMVIVAFDIENTNTSQTVNAFDFTNVISKIVITYATEINPSDIIILPAATNSRYKLWQRLVERYSEGSEYQPGSADLISPLLKSSLLDPNYQIVTWVKNHDNN